MSSTITIQSAVAEARRDLDELRDRVSDLLAQRAEVEQEPCDREEAERRVRALVEGARQRGVLAMPGLFAAEQAPVSQYLGRRLADDVFSALATVCPDALAAALLDAHPGGGLSVDGRLARLAEIDAALFAAEVAEECCCRELERALGTAVPRRADADCAVLLAPDEELEPPDEPEPEPTTRRKP